jgi:hypothetical protein
MTCAKQKYIKIGFLEVLNFFIDLLKKFRSYLSLAIIISRGGSRAGRVEFRFGRTGSGKFDKNKY